MDEPHIPAAIETSEGEKPEIDEVAFAGDQLEKPMDVDEPFPTTSAAAEAIPEALLESNVAEDSEIKTGEEEAGNTLEEDVNQTIEQVNFDKDTESPEAIVNSTLDYTERSINISQIDCANQDDSNDAFNALKRDETDVLNEMKEEPAEKPENETPMETEESPTDLATPPQASSPPPSIDENSESTSKTPAEESETAEATEETPAANDNDEPVEPMDQTDLGTIEEEGNKEIEEESGEKDESEDIQKPSEDTESVQSPAPSDSVDKPAEEVEDDEAETTNEGKFLNFILNLA